MRQQGAKESSKQEAGADGRSTSQSQIFHFSLVICHVPLLKLLWSEMKNEN
jgi:hypothetical protein